MVFKKIFVVGLGCFIFTTQNAWAWGKRGHQTVGEVAAILASLEPNSEFLRFKSYDMGFYNNVPDIVWKRPATNKSERNEHFMDMEIFDRAFAKKSITDDPYKLSRAEFEKKFPEIKSEAGRAFWRVREMVDRLEKITTKLRALGNKKSKEKQKLQEEWLVLAGTMGHYIADLSQPLHVSENYDGQLTDQKGVHSYFEDQVVDELYPQVMVKVTKAAKKAWPDFKKKNAEKSTLELMREMTLQSSGKLKTLLDFDKKGGRKSLNKDAARFEPIVVDSLTSGALVLAEIWRRNLNWQFDSGSRFYFNGEPSHIKPGS